MVLQDTLLRLVNFFSQIQLFLIVFVKLVGRYDRQNYLPKFLAQQDYLNYFELYFKILLHLIDKSFSCMHGQIGVSKLLDYHLGLSGQ